MSTSNLNDLDTQWNVPTKVQPRSELNKLLKQSGRKSYKIPADWYVILFAVVSVSLAIGLRLSH